MKFEDINRCDFLHVGGIYILKSKIDDRRYIGSAKSFYNRLINHRCALLGGYHKGVKLSNFVKKYGLDCIDIQLIPMETTNRNELFVAEKQYIVMYDSVTNGFNCSYETRNAVVPYTEERRRKIGLKSIGRKIFSEEEKIQLSLNCKWNNCQDKHPNAKLKNNDVVEIKKMLFLKYKPSDICKIYNVSYNAIYNIKTENKWSSIKVDYNEITNEEINNFKHMFSFIYDNIVRSDGGISKNNVLEIRNLFKNNISKNEIQNKFNISRQCLNAILSKRNYKYLEAEVIKDQI